MESKKEIRKDGAAVTIAAIREGRALAQNKTATGFSTIADLRSALEADEEEE